MSGDTHYYVQCWLRRGPTRQMAWIPEKHAVIGRFLRLTEAGVSEDGWEVIGAGARQPVEYVRERSQDYKNTRRASDIRRPALAPLPQLAEGTRLERVQSAFESLEGHHKFLELKPS